MHAVETVNLATKLVVKEIMASDMVTKDGSTQSNKLYSLWKAWYDLAQLSIRGHGSPFNCQSLRNMSCSSKWYS